MFKRSNEIEEIPSESFFKHISINSNSLFVLNLSLTLIPEVTHCPSVALYCAFKKKVIC